MHKIINSPASAVDDYVNALAARTPSLARVAGWNVLARAGSDPAQLREVAVISGGGSGHEPAHAGYVGEGMLHAAVLGEVFTSPSADAVHAAIKATAGRAGALLVVKNYTGDKLNFGIAAEMAKADGIPVETVLVGDDVALPGETRVGPRGIAGTVLVHKIAGAASARGMNLAETAEAASAFARKLGSMGVATGPCTLPGALRPSFDLPQGEIEWGLGIHGEPGRERGSAHSAKGIATRLVGHVVEQKAIPPGAAVVVLVNGLGATTALELEIVGAEVQSALNEHRIHPVRMWTGSYLTALDMAGVSVSLAQVTDDELELLDAPASTVAWRAAPRLDPGMSRTSLVIADAGPDNDDGRNRRAEDLSVAITAVTAAAEAVIAAEPALTDLDRAIGDGDLGTNLARGAQRILAAVGTLSRLGSHQLLLRELAALLRRHVGGTSGPLYSLLALGAAEELARADPSPGTWARAFAAGTSAVRRVGGAEVGDRTMVDALAPAAETLCEALDDGRPAEAAVRLALSAAEAGARATEQMHAGLGRSSYLGERVAGHPDPGAVAVVVWLRAVATCLYGDN
ncbi:dihydroxyacetone kinase subunit DhaL [Saccharomonospora sp. NPDC046836]|uniref:dihydroxyacetone kinase subunit DhaL n=1 Tax=Saccharomonospora sp. NPDC046836 TaxID=3156921 RepID=UPI0033D08071